MDRGPGTTSEMETDLREVVRDALLRRVPSEATVAVGLSGGMDSVALLDAMSESVPDGIVLRACHVHHGVSARADAWAAFCESVCAARNIPLQVVRKKPRRVSEDALRELRLRAFADAGADFVALAHHADDQNETALFRMLRGTGLAGLTGMRELSPLPGDGRIGILRPFLKVPRSAIFSYARERRLRWAEDEDNLNLARRRNFLRWKLLPLAARSFPNAGGAPGAVAARLADSADLLRALAAADSESASGPDDDPNNPSPDDDASRAEGWSVERLRTLGEARVANWLHSELSLRGAPPPERAALEAARQIVSARPGARMSFAFGRHKLVARGTRLAWAGEKPGTVGTPSGTVGTPSGTAGKRSTVGGGTNFANRNRKR